MEIRNNMRHSRRIAALIAASAIAGTMPMTAYATIATKPDENYAVGEKPRPDINKPLSPEFAYTEEKWASLKDNILEYGELTDLVHEYNPTVRSNRSTYNDQKGKNLNDAYNDYLDAIDDIWDTTDTSNDVSWATARFQTSLLRQQADNSYQDADMEKIQYDQAEAGLVYQAQQLMVTLEQSKYTIENLESTRNLLQAQYEAAVARQASGLATQTDVLTAQKNVQDQDKTIVSTKKSADNVHRGLCLMLGWSVDGQPEIKAVPQPDLNRINSMNPDADLETAVANNYDVKYYEKKAGNLTSQYLIDSNNASIQDAKNKVAKSLKAQHNTVLTTRDTLSASIAALQVAEVNLNTATAQKAVGQITELEFQNVQNAYVSAKNSVETNKLQLLLAMDTYDWNVKGLTTSN